MKSVLTIAGSDSSGGAGIQADIKTIISNGAYATSVITALTAQNTLGVSKIFPVDSEFVGEQLESVLTDIPPNAVKIGMVGDKDTISVISKKLYKYKVNNVVIDPVMVSTSGSRLICDEALENLKKELFPYATIITPNIPEAEILSSMEIKSKGDMEKAATIICKDYSVDVLLKGGHSIEDASDVLVTSEGIQWFYGERIDNPNTHGTGCTLSSAIASNIAKGKTVEESVRSSKKYISKALNAMLDIGKGQGPLNHGFNIEGDY